MSKEITAATEVELTSQQQHLSKIVREYLKNEYPKWKVTQDDVQFFHINSGMRFLSFNFADFKEQIAFLNIREDGDTRTAYNGFFQTLDQLKDILKNIW